MLPQQLAAVRGQLPQGYSLPVRCVLFEALRALLIPRAGWYWHKIRKVCKPKHPRAPEPDCDDWNPGKHCCGHPPSYPSPKPRKSAEQSLSRGMLADL